MQFVQPIWLWAAAGIIVPVLIHLWNVREGKTLKVGSILFLSESARSRAKSFQLSEWLLLLLRCLLLIVLAMLIAKPFYEKQLDTLKEKGWLLIEKSQVQEAYHKYKPAIDTLIKQGYTFHYFDADFAEAKFEDVLKLPADGTKATQEPYWALLKKLDAKIPSGLPVALFTDNRLSRFTGSRPAISLHLNWQTYTSTDTVSNWIEKAYTTNDSIRIIAARSNPSATIYRHQSISPANGGDKFIINATGGKTYISYKDTSNTIANSTVEVDSSPLNIAIYTDKFSLDASYLKAAINAVKDFTKYPVKLVVISSVQSIPANCNWLFWLSEETIPAALMKDNVFVYEKGKADNRHSTIITEDDAAVNANEEVAIFKAIQSAVPGRNAQAIWQNGFGEPLLSVEKQKASVYHFYSHFNPQWNDLTWSNRFPQIMYDLLFSIGKMTKEINPNDKRIMDSAQMQPIITKDENAVSKQYLATKQDLSKIFWLIALALFIAERMLSFKVKKEEVYA